MDFFSCAQGLAHVHLDNTPKSTSTDYFTYIALTLVNSTKFSLGSESVLLPPKDAIPAKERETHVPEIIRNYVIK